MFGISFAELLVVMVVALLVFGPEKLPEIASKIGQLSFQLKKASDGFRREFYNSVYVPAKEQTDLLSSGLEQAKNSLTKLPDVIPPDVTYQNNDEKIEASKVQLKTDQLESNKE